MIFDRLTEAARYEALHPLFADAFRFLAEAKDLAAGHYELRDGMFANVVEGETSPAEKGVYEAHEQFIDIQCLLKGETALLWANPADLKPNCEYNAADDYRLYHGSGASIRVKPGDFYVLFPADAHLPHTDPGHKSAFKVAIVKVPIAKEGKQ